MDEDLICTDDKDIVKVKWNDIFYFESIDKKTFVYTENNIFNINKRLYELEEKLTRDFIRCSKSCIINLSRVKYFKTLVGLRLEATMINNEKIIVNRKYVKDIKNKISEGGNCMNFINKYSEAIGAFWGASVFIGALISILLGFKIIGNINWLPSILIGMCSFLILGLLFQGIISLMKKDK